MTAIIALFFITIHGVKCIDLDSASCLKHNNQIAFSASHLVE